MRIISKLIKPVYAHCDLPCGVYDPMQAQIEAQSVFNIMNKFDEADENTRIRAIMIKEQRCELVKHHLWVLWTDYFKPEHLDKHPDLHDLFWKATKKAGECKKSVDPKVGQELIDYINKISDVFRETKNA